VPCVYATSTRLSASVSVPMFVCLWPWLHLAFTRNHPRNICTHTHRGVLCLKLSPNLRKTETIRAKDKLAAGAAAAGDAPRKPPPKKKGDADTGAAEEKVKTPAEQEVFFFHARARARPDSMWVCVCVGVCVCDTGAV